MNGEVDANGRALLQLFVSKRLSENYVAVTCWIDTAFDGHLVFSSELIEELGLDTLAEPEAVLADGSTVTLDTYLCFLDWFGNRVPIQVIANEGKLPLLGIGLLEHRVLHIDYEQRTVSVD